VLRFYKYSANVISLSFHSANVISLFLYLFIVRDDVCTIATLTFVRVCAVCVRGAGGVQELRERMRSVKVVATT